MTEELDSCVFDELDETLIDDEETILEEDVAMLEELSALERPHVA